MAEDTKTFPALTAEAINAARVGAELDTLVAVAIKATDNEMLMGMLADGRWSPSTAWSLAGMYSDRGICSYRRRDGRWSAYTEQGTLLAPAEVPDVQASGSTELEAKARCLCWTELVRAQAAANETGAPKCDAP